MSCSSSFVHVSKNVYFSLKLIVPLSFRIPSTLIKNFMTCTHTNRSLVAEKYPSKEPYLEFLVPVVLLDAYPFKISKSTHNSIQIPLQALRSCVEAPSQAESKKCQSFGLKGSTEKCVIFPKHLASNLHTSCIESFCTPFKGFCIF